MLVKVKKNRSILTLLIVNGTMNVINKIKTKNFIFASTGVAKSCESAYGISKRAAEDVVRSYSEMTSMDYTIFRFYNVIGSTVKFTKLNGLFYNLIEVKNRRIYYIRWRL